MTTDDDREEILRELDRVAAEYVARQESWAQARRLIADALLAGVDPHELYGRPFSAPVVRAIAAELNVPVVRPARRPRESGGR
jgi:hypothetical protein